jgi:hypothetical protein
MKKLILLAVVALVSFLIGTIGLYVAMPSLAPHVVDSTRVKLDSLGLIPSPPADSLTALADSAMIDSLTADSSVIKPVDAISNADATLLIIGQLSDSLMAAHHLAQNLTLENKTLRARMAELEKQLSGAGARSEQAAELSKIVTKLEDEQLSGVLAGVDLGVIEVLYQQSSARDRTRLLQNLAPERAAAFVKTIVKGPISEADVTAGNPETPSEPANQ